MSKVSLVKNNQSYQGVLKVLEPLKIDLKAKLKNLDKVVIKINFVTTERELATTPLKSVKGFIDFIKPFFKGKIVIAEEASIGNTRQCFERYGFKSLAEKDPQVEIFDSAEDEIKQITFNYPSGTITLPLAKIYLKPNFIISITRAKTHDSVVVTLGIKNVLFGAIQGGLSQRSKVPHNKNIHWIMTEIAKHTYPDFVLIDGTTGMQGNGPESGDPIKANFLAAGFDVLAVDSLVTYLMGFNIKDVGYLNLLREENFGKLYPQDKIKIIGFNPKNLITSFKPHPTFSEQRHWH